MSIYGISIFGSKHVLVAGENAIFNRALKSCCVRTCLWLIGIRYIPIWQSNNNKILPNPKIIICVFNNRNSSRNY